MRRNPQLPFGYWVGTVYRCPREVPGASRGSCAFCNRRCSFRVRAWALGCGAQLKDLALAQIVCVAQAIKPHDLTDGHVFALGDRRQGVAMDNDIMLVRAEGGYGDCQAKGKSTK